MNNSSEITELLPVSEYHDPFKIKEEDHVTVQEIQVCADNLQKYRQEIGRLFQLLCTMQNRANDTEVRLAEKRNELVSKYGLESLGTGQWAIDFEKKEFVRIADRAAVIP